MKRKQMTKWTKKQKVVYDLRHAFNKAVDLAGELHIDPKWLEEVKLDTIDKIIDACPDADPGTFIELADGSWVTWKTIREHPDAFVALPDGRLAHRDAANVVSIRPPDDTDPPTAA
jgi:hypothetical protein